MPWVIWLIEQFTHHATTELARRTHDASLPSRPFDLDLYTERFRLSHLPPDNPPGLDASSRANRKFIAKYRNDTSLKIQDAYDNNLLPDFPEYF